jgi:hypothetical protein
MTKKIIISIVIVLILAAGGFFWWQENQKDVRELNENLPEGVRVTKSLFSNEYWVINKIDGYEFKVPDAWGGLNEIEYVPERKAQGYIGSSLYLEGKEGFGRVVGIDRFTSGGDVGADLKSWAEANFDAFGLVGDFSENMVGEINVAKTQENVHLGGEYVYFFEKNGIFYTITGPSEKFIREIILNGKW